MHQLVDPVLDGTNQTHPCTPVRIVLRKDNGNVFSRE